MGYARHDSGHCAVHAVLRDSLPDGRAADRRHESVGAVAGPAAPDVWLRHLPLPADGRGPDFQARHGLHPGRGRDCGSLLRGGGWSRRTGAHAGAELRADRFDPGDGGDGAAVRSRPQVDSGADRPVLLPHPLRLPQDADRIRPRAERGNRSRPDAEFGGRSFVANAAGGSHGDFPLRR